MTQDTRSVILEKAEFLIRTRGYSAFSYADLAEHAQITKASVHYHFATKADLIVVLVDAYMERFVSALAQIRAQHGTAPGRLRNYANLFLAGFEKGMLPLCGALSAERSALPEVMHTTVHDFFQTHIDWLESVLNEGVAAGDLRADLTVESTALLLLSTLEGGSFVGWALKKTEPVLAAFEAALRTIQS